MSKIVYPETESLSSLVRNSLNDGLQSLNNAQNQCVYTIPGDFAYLSYLRGLGSKISGFRQDVLNIYKSIEGIDQSYRATLDSLDGYRESLDLSIIEERSRLIK